MRSASGDRDAALVAEVSPGDRCDGTTIQRTHHIVESMTVKGDAALVLVWAPLCCPGPRDVAKFTMRRLARKEAGVKQKSRTFWNTA